MYLYRVAVVRSGGTRINSAARWNFINLSSSARLKAKIIDIISKATSCTYVQGLSANDAWGIASLLVLTPGYIVERSCREELLDLADMMTSPTQYVYIYYNVLFLEARLKTCRVTARALSTTKYFWCYELREPRLYSCQLHTYSCLHYTLSNWQPIKKRLMFCLDMSQ
jgi:hypothetical protein